MDYAEFVRGTTFRHLQPETPRPTGYRGLSMLLRSVGIQLDAANTRLPSHDREIRQRLKQVARIPRMSTFAIGAMINQAVAQLPRGQCFLNIGVWHGYTFFSGLAGNEHQQCIAVDNFSLKNSPREAFLDRFQRYASPHHTFHEMDFREYLKQVHQTPIGFYLFDGPHQYEDQYEGLQLAEPYFADNCIVMVDDCNWQHVHAANSDFMKKSVNSYKLLIDKKTPKSGHPTYWNGLMIFQLEGKNALAKAKGPARRAA
jgi:hypothetical protein